MYCSDESSPGRNQQDDDDQAKILATSFKQSDIHPPTASAANPMTTFDNPVYAATKGAGLPRLELDEDEIVKEDLAMIGKPLYEDDIEL